jgi:hypothetical protein
MAEPSQPELACATRILESTVTGHQRGNKYLLAYIIRLNKFSLSIRVVLSVVGLILGVTSSPQAAHAANFALGSSKTIQGVTISWPENIYVPDGTNFPIIVSFANNSGRNVLKAEWILKDSSGVTVAERSVIGLDNGSTSYEITNVIRESFKAGPGTYRLVMRVEGYSGSGTFQEEQFIQVLPWSQNQATPFSPSLVTNKNTINLSGFTFKWPANISIPSSGNVGVEIEFQNQTGVNILSAELMILDYKGSRIIERSVIGLNAGATSIQEDNTISQSFPLGAGVYKVIAATTRYNGNFSQIGEAYIEVKAAPGPPKSVTDLSASRSANELNYKFTKPASYSPISYYDVIVQAILSPGLDPSSYANYGQMYRLKQSFTESFSLSQTEMKTFLTGKVPNVANTTFMVRVQAYSADGGSYLSNGIYSNTSGFITTVPTTATKSIVCKKGKLTKVVKGTAPRCPTGYKKAA